MNQTAIGSYIARKRKEQNLAGAVGRATRCVQQDDLKMGKRKMYAGLQHHPNAL